MRRQLPGTTKSGLKRREQHHLITENRAEGKRETGLCEAVDAGQEKAPVTEKACKGSWSWP
jgi:hypothetical protein